MPRTWRNAFEKVTFYESLDELPAFTDYSMKGRTYRFMKGKAQYPFGFGLTYGDVSVTGARALNPDGSTKTWFRQGEDITLEITAENTGKAAADVLEVYVRMESAADTNWSLYGFARESFAEDEAKTITMKIRASSFDTINEEGKPEPEGTEAVLFVGTSQPDAVSRELTGREPVSIRLKRRA